jgi:glyoxylase I family protein
MITGIHHISMKCRSNEELEKVKDFYTRVLGMSLYREWENGALIDTGRGLIEVFNRPGGEYRLGVIAHFALETDDVDDAAARVKAAGYTVFEEPVDFVIPANPDMPIRKAFCYGPLGEEIELFHVY